MKSDLSEPLVKTPTTPVAPSATPWTCYTSLIATMIGVGILSLPISISYCGLVPGIALILSFGIASDASLQCLVRAAELTGADSYSELGGACFGRTGKRAVVLCLLALLAASAVIVHICIVDLSQSLAVSCGFSLPRLPLALGVTPPLLALSLPWQLHNLSTAASTAIFAILFATYGMLATFAKRGIAADVSMANFSARSSLAIPIHALAFAWCVFPFGFSSGSPHPINSTGPLLCMRTHTLTPLPAFPALRCSHFSVVELRRELPPHRQGSLPTVVHAACASAALVYASFGAAGYLTLGSVAAANYPNVLVAFPEEPLLVSASGAGMKPAIPLSIPQSL